LPLGTAQNPQARVQMSPKIMKVAVPCSQHSPMLGQRALSHTVCKSRVRMVRFNSWYFGPPKNFTRSQDGRGCAIGGGVESGRIVKGVAIWFIPMNYSTRNSGGETTVRLELRFSRSSG
jgi:hypothetical protein